MDACIRKGESPVLFSKYAVFDERARNSCRRQEKGALAEGKKGNAGEDERARNSCQKNKRKVN